LVWETNNWRARQKKKEIGAAHGAIKSGVVDGGGLEAWNNWRGLTDGVGQRRSEGGVIERDK